jgi:hypothetical protein
MTKNRKHVRPTTQEYVYVDVPDGFCEANHRRNAMRFWFLLLLFSGTSVRFWDNLQCW